MPAGFLPLAGDFLPFVTCPLVIRRQAMMISPKMHPIPAGLISWLPLSLRREKAGYWIFQGVFALIIFSVTASGILTANTTDTPIPLTVEQMAELKRLVAIYIRLAWVEGVLEIVLIFFLTHALLLYSQRRGWLEKSLPRLVARALAACALLGLVMAVTIQTVSWLAFDLPNEPLFLSPDSAVLMLVRWPSTALDIAAWCALYYGFQAYTRLTRLQFERLQQEAAAKDARLDAIAAQINPHFLFNCLNTVRALIDEDPGRARDAVTALARVLRASLQNSRQRLIPLAEEMETVEAHLSLELARHGGRLTVTGEIAPDALSAMVPPLLIQTLVENAIKHGVAARPGPGFVRYAVWIESSALMVEIRNNGALGRLGNGLGLVHTRERLQLLFGSADLLDLSAGIGGVTARVRIPLNPPHKPTP